MSSVECNCVLDVVLALFYPSAVWLAVVDPGVQSNAYCRPPAEYDVLVPPPQPFYGPFFQDHPGEPVPEENFWTLWCKRRLTEADTQTIQLGTTPSELTSANLHHPP